ncbi:sugar phosphate nucleotidyltransferase [Gorillibacterium massiliense]|uniref:sugar phosphate nucleotidyltransferase n=1 Tax=Gorillibacterium massiliense TaxID=1280390 RepID=UPI0004B885E2|nr:sugar phosphate nucleotidyltransferase [Gorillibacterium massiliense]
MNSEDRSRPKLNIILLSGGSGKRLWPLSNDIRSKAFLKLLDNGRGERESMIQRVTRQLKSAGFASDVTIVAHESQQEMIRSHIGKHIPIIPEPAKRGTFTAIALAATYLHSVRKTDHEDHLCILPVDLFVQGPFYQLLRQIPGVLERSQGEMVFIGTRPHFPSTQFGYILPQKTEDSGYMRVSRFYEKPDTEKAAELIQEGALWNCGIFAFTLQFILDILLENGLPIEYEDLLERYERLPERNFEKEIAEKTNNAAVIAHDEEWNDLGGWESLMDHMKESLIGPGELSADCTNSQVINELSLPIRVIGLNGVIVAASADGILVADKKVSSRIKDMLGNDPDSPGYEEKSWGSRTVLDRHSTPDGPNSITSKLKVVAGHVLIVGKEEDSRCLWNKVWIILNGKGKLTLNRVQRLVSSGDVLRLPAGRSAILHAFSDMELLEVKSR